MKPIISLSPHIHGGDSIQKNMYGVCIALVPALLASLWFFGLGAAIVLSVSVLSCVLFEWAITKFLLKRPACTICDGSAVRNENTSGPQRKRNEMLAANGGYTGIKIYGSLHFIRFAAKTNQFERHVPGSS